mmetsp:Transcript_48016/g.114287  ORF Transcript_48016/g.114287 Transcript_48016/m.114287 type:complete len:287 (-) Transcript_48016:199-1059(-)
MKEQDDVVPDLEVKFQDDPQDRQKHIFLALDKQNAIVAKSNDPGVLQRDAANFRTLTKIALKDALKVSAGDGYVFNTQDFFKRLKTKYEIPGDDDSYTIDWRKFNTEAMRFCNYVPSCTFMAHACAKEPPVKKARNSQREKRAPVVETAPEDGRALGDDKTSTKRHLQLRAKVLQWEKGEFMPLAKLVTDPACFCETIENLFAVGFLIDEKTLLLSLADDKSFQVERGERPVKDAKGKEVAADPNAQPEANAGRLIVDMSTEKWRSVIDRYKIKEAYFKFDPTAGM